MGQGLQGEPNVYTAGNDFDYSVWTAGTIVDLVNVNWNNDYRDVVKFDNKGALNAFLNSLAPASVQITNMTYVKPNSDVMVPIPYNRVNRYNYLRASNPLMPVDGDIQKDYYYFILDAEYINPQTTRLRLQLDVWQTYVYDVSFGQCYVERGHIGIANEKQFDNYGRDYLTTPEGLDIGADYRHIAKRTEEIVSLAAGSISYQHDVLVVSTTDLNQDPGTPANPGMKSARGSSVHDMPSGASFYLFPSVTDFRTWLTSVQNAPWLTQGIVSITVMPKIKRYNANFIYSPVPDEPQHINIAARPIKHSMFSNWRNSDEIINWIPEKYRHLRKFFTYPYMVIEATTWSATPVVLRPEAWQNANADVLERPNYMPPNQRVQFIPRSYNSSGQAPDAFWGMTNAEFVQYINSLPDVPGFNKSEFIARFGDLGDDYGDYLDVVTQIAAFPSLPVVNNMALNYLASNAHSIAYQRQSADWTQQRALGMARGQYDVASGGIRAAQELTDIGVSAALAQTASQNQNLTGQALVNALGGIGGGIAAGSAFGPGGALVGGVSGAASGLANGFNAGLQTMRNDEATAISNSQARQNLGVENRQAYLSRDTNMELARFASNGDYANTIAGINAKVQDAAMIQPSIAGQYGGDAINLAQGTMEFSMRWKMIDNAAMRIIGDYWLRFGYAIRAFMVPPQSLMVMSKFTYWKMTQAYLTSSMVPESHKNVLRGILEKGVTVYKNPSDIGFVDIADNAPLSGVSY